MALKRFESDSVVQRQDDEISKVIKTILDFIVRTPRSQYDTKKLLCFVENNFKQMKDLP